MDKIIQQMAEALDPIAFNKGLQGYNIWALRRAGAGEKAQTVIAAVPALKGLLEAALGKDTEPWGSESRRQVIYRARLFREANS